MADAKKGECTIRTRKFLVNRLLNRKQFVRFLTCCFSLFSFLEQVVELYCSRVLSAMRA